MRHYMGSKDGEHDFPDHKGFVMSSVWKPKTARQSRSTHVTCLYLRLELRGRTWDAQVAFEYRSQTRPYPET